MLIEGNFTMQRIDVTSPLIPPLEEFVPYLERIWESRWLTNNGEFCQELENELGDYLDVDFISLVSNGTLALIIALKSLQISGEVITTPFSFVATTHALWWNGIKPVFVDIEPETFMINPNRIESAITPKTTAIMPVHVYGNPCNDEEINEIAKKNNLKIIYDAAHVFGVNKNGVSVANFGDLSALSFHATKVFSTVEGGAIVSHDKSMKSKIDYLRNFGIQDETTVVLPGINAKMNELQAAYGLLSLKHVDQAIKRRKKIAQLYQEKLKNIEGIHFIQDIEGIKHNYAYFPILVEKERYGLDRDLLYEKLKKFNIHGRRYFYPLISDFPPYCELSSAQPSNLPVATKIAQEILCLPIHPYLKEDDILRVIEIIASK